MAAGTHCERRRGRSTAPVTAPGFPGRTVSGPRSGRRPPRERPHPPGGCAVPPRCRPNPEEGRARRRVGGATRDFIVGPVASGAMAGVGTDCPTSRENCTAGGSAGLIGVAGGDRLGRRARRRVLCRGRVRRLGSERPGSSLPLTGKPVATVDFLALLSIVGCGVGTAGAPQHHHRRAVDRRR